MNDTIGLEEAAAILRMAPSTLRKRAAAGKVPGYKPGREWTFIRAEVYEHLKACRPPCPSIAAPGLRIGGAGSRLPAEKSDFQLAQRIAAKRKSLKRTLALVPGGKSDSESAPLTRGVRRGADG